MSRNAAPSRVPQRIRRPGEAGQSLVESTFVILLVCLMFFGFLQVAVLYNHERILQFASFAAARSAMVGFQSQIYNRAYQVAAISASGKMLEPQQNLSPKAQLAYELIDIPLFLNHDPQTRLNYEYWRDFGMIPNVQIKSATPPMIWEFHEQVHPMVIPMFSAYYGRDTIPIYSQSEQAHHAEYYLVDAKPNNKPLPP